MTHQEKTRNEEGKSSSKKELEIDAPDSVYEKEADAAAARVVNGDQLMGGANPAKDQVMGGASRNDGMISAKGEGRAEPGMVAPGHVQQGVEAAQGGGNALPEDAKRVVKGQSAWDLEGVRIHTDSKAAELAKSVGAKAFTHGKDIYFGQGMYDTYTSSGKELLAHELAHTRQNAGPGVIQRSPKTTGYGTFKDEKYEIVNDGTKNIGVEMHLKFKANDNVDASKIAMVQSVNPVINNTPVTIHPNKVDKRVDSGAGKGYEIDRLSQYNNPVYGSTDLAPGEGLEKTETTNASVLPAAPPDATYELGEHYNDKGTPKDKEAWLYDKPVLDGANNSKQIFETAAVAIEGTQKGTYYGSVKWGWEQGASAATFKKLDMSLASLAVPSQNFLAPAKKWNDTRVSGTLVTNTVDVIVEDAVGVELFKLPKDVEVEMTDAAGDGTGKVWGFVTVKTGTHTGDTGYIKMQEMTDKGDGAETVDLPLFTGTSIEQTKMGIEPYLKGYTISKSLTVGLDKTTPTKTVVTLTKGSYRFGFGAALTSGNATLKLYNSANELLFDAPASEIPYQDFEIPADGDYTLEMAPAGAGESETQGVLLIGKGK